jgi:hypothetical protein
LETRVGGLGLRSHMLRFKKKCEYESLEAMIERIRDSWPIFAGGRPGMRFPEHYRLHHKRRRPARFDLVCLLYIVGGGVLIVVSALLGWLPVLSWATAILGLWAYDRR